MNHFQFQKLIKDIPSIEVSLNWCYDEGQGSFEKEFASGKFTISTSFTCFETGIIDPGDYFTEPSFSSDGLSVDDFELNIYDKDGDEINLTLKQEEKLFKEVELSIISI